MSVTDLTTPPNPLAVFSVVPAVDPLNLLHEVPPFERGAPEIQAVLGVVANELLRLEAARQALIQNFFPGTADALLPLFEEMLGLPVAPPASLALRQSLVLASMRRLKGEGRGLDWEATITQLIGGAAWSYQEHLASPPTNVVPNPSFEYDTTGTSTPAGWYTPGNLASRTVATNWASRGSKSLRVVTSALTNAQQASYFITGPDAGPGAQSGTTGWNISRLATKQLAGQLAYNVNTITGTWNTYLEFWCYDATGAFIAAPTLGGAAATATGPGSKSAVVTLPANTAWFKISAIWYCQANGTLDISIDAVSVVFDATVVPGYYDGDTGGYQWSGTPGNSTSFLSSPPANTVSIKIPSAAAGIGWPFIRDLTPAHLAITQGYSDGFFVGITNVGGNL